MNLIKVHNGRNVLFLNLDQLIDADYFHGEAIQEGVDSQTGKPMQGSRMVKQLKMTFRGGEYPRIIALYNQAADEALSSLELKL